MATHKIINFKLVQYASMHYENQFGEMIRNKPKGRTIYGGLKVVDDSEAIPYYMDYPNETQLERARRLGIIDQWRPIVVFTYSSNKTVCFTGEKAKSMWEGWSKYIFDK